MENAAVVGALSVPVIVLLVQMFKKVIPGLPGQAWLATSFILGMASQMFAAGATSAPTDYAGWVNLVFAGLVSGAAASKAYDELIDRG